MRRSTAALYGLALLGMLRPGVFAQNAADAVPAQQPSRNAAKPVYLAGKPELARAYIELERLMMERTPTLEPRVVAEIGRGFDRAANAYFVGDYSGAVLGIDAEIEKLAPSGGLRAVSARVEPMVVRTGTEQPITIRIAPSYVASKKLETGIAARAVREGGDPADAVALGTLVREEGGFAGRDLSGRLSSAAPACWRVQVGEVGKEAGWRGVTKVYATTESLDVMRNSLVSTLEDAERVHPELLPAIAACRSRVRLLSDRSSLESTYLIVNDLLALIVGVDKEATELSAGRDPYFRAAGDYWLTLHVGDGDIPVRLFAPPAAHPDAERPLIIAVHGAGGDENLWLDGYGAGELKRWAAEKNVLIVSPRIGLGTFMPGSLDGLIEAAARWQAVDRSRVYVLGHSLGGGIVTAWAKQRPEKVAAACAIAGIGVYTGTKEIAPMLAVSGETDMLIPADRIRRSAEAAKAQGLPVEYREIASAGHLLVVGQATRGAAEWLLEHRRPTAKGARNTAPDDAPATPRR